MRIHPLLLLLASLSACSDPTNPGGDGSTTAASTSTTASTPTTGDAPPTSTTDPTSTEPAGTDTSGTTTGDPTTSGDAWVPASCYDGWDDLKATFPDAGTLIDCVDAGFTVQRSLLVVDGLTIDNNGVAMNPCVEARCDADYAYIASNNIPHYDFIQITPNALAEAATLVRVPLVPTLPADNADADAPEIQDGCLDAYDQHLDAPDTSTPREPSGLCISQQGDAAYLRETLASGATVTTAKINCLGNIAIMNSGVVIAGPNEAQTPDPYGDPLFYMPNTAGEPYIGTDLGDGPALDLCGGHTGGSMHYHGANQACFEQAPDGTPANSYATASQAWDLAQMLTGACTAPSPILGWSPDGYPIKGPCVCTDADCKTVKRARSTWVYSGLGSWGDDPAAGDLAMENQACTTDDECCPGGKGCNFRCAPVIVDDDGPDGTAVEDRCVVLDYSWCTHRFVDRSTHPGADGFVYMDRCNGYDGPDGYAYHATVSFPYFQACTRGVPTAVEQAMGGMDDGGMMDGGMDPPMCMNGQMKCCGDDVCDGPETADNCPADCG